MFIKTVCSVFLVYSEICHAILTTGVGEGQDLVPGLEEDTGEINSIMYLVVCEAKKLDCILEI